MLEVEDSEPQHQRDDDRARDRTGIDVMSLRGPQDVGEAVDRDDRQRNRAFGVVDGSDRVQPHVGVQ